MTETPTPAQLRLLKGAEKVRLDDPFKAYMTRQFIQCTLPHRDPGDVPYWHRRNGNVVLMIQPGFDFAMGRPCGYPFGTLPRLLLFWIVTQAKKKQSPIVQLGNSLTEFLHLLDLDPTSRGKRSDGVRLRVQMERLFKARISLTARTVNGDVIGDHFRDLSVVHQHEIFWHAKTVDQNALWSSWLQLNEGFYRAICENAVPANMHALAALKQSPLALDLYALLNYLTGTLKKPHVIAWRLLHGQMGSDFATVDDFRRKTLAALAKVRTVHPGLNVEQIRGGLRISPGTPAIAPKDAIDSAN